MFLLHTDISGEITANSFLREVLLDGFLDTLKLIPFLFLTYLLMEFIEHKASDKALGFMKKSGNLGPLIGGAFGIAPQCAFSAVASNLYTGRVITLGTMLAVFLSTSDEMLPILIAGSAQPKSILIILLYKAAVAVAMGFTVDILIRLFCGGKKEINIDEICENDNCHCEKGILYSAIHHTVTISIFVFIITLLLNTVIFFIGTERLSHLGEAAPVLSHLIFAFLGLIPSCATSVAIATLGMREIISAGAMLSGLFTSAGVGTLILWRLNSNKKENLIIMLVLAAIGFTFGLLADAIGITV